MINTKRLVISSLNKNDKEDLIRLFEDDEVWKYLGGTPSTPYVCIDNWLSQQTPFLYYALRKKDNNDFVGIISIRPHHNRPYYELSYYLLTDFWGNGYAAEAIKPLLINAFNKLNINHIIAQTQSANKSSCKLLQKLGFKHTETFIEFNAEQTLWSMSDCPE